MDAVRDGFKALPAELQEHYRAEALGFIGQEATHRHLHSLFNGHLDRQGLVNGHLHRQGLVNEHFTVIFSK